MKVRLPMRESVRSAVFAALLVVPLMLLLSITVQAADTAAEEIDRGRELYDNFGCYQCHGHSGQGGNAGPKIAPDPLPYEGFKVFVRTPVARMPPYTDAVLSEEQLQQIHRYLASLRRGPAASEVGLLDLTIQPASTPQ